MISLRRLISRHDKKGAMMASGDHLKIWFPAMIEGLRRAWQPGMVIPPFITEVKSRDYAANANF